MPLADYLAGLAFFSGTVGAVGASTWIVLHRRAPQLTGVPLTLAFFVVFAAWLIGVHLVPLALTILSSGTVLALAVLALAAATRVPAVAAAEPNRTPAPETESSLVSWAIAGVASIGTLGYLLVYLKEQSTLALTHIDAMSFTLPNVVRWIQDGSVWANNVLIPGFPVGAYPNNGDVAFLSTMLPWDSEAFVRPLTALLVVITGVAVYGLARELGAPRSSAVIFAVLPLTLRVLMVPAVESAKPDVFMVAAFMSGLLFLVRHVRTRSNVDLVLAGVALGLAFGSRWYGVLFAPVVIALWAGGMALARERPRWIASRAVALGLLTLAAGGFWLIRNWEAAGNPFFPVKIELLGATIFDAGPDPIREKYGYSIAHYLGDWSVFSDAIIPDWKQAFGQPGALLVVGLLLAVCAIAFARRRAGRLERSEAVALALAVLAALLALVYINIPATAQGPEGQPFEGLVGGNSRYVVPSFLIAAALTAWVAGRIGRGRIVLELAALVALADGIDRSFYVPWMRAALAAALAILVVAAAGGVVVGIRRLKPPARRLAAAVAATLALGAVAAAGYVDQDRFADKRYRGVDPITDALAFQPDGTRVGIVGNWTPDFVPIFPAFGQSYGNEVVYVGRFDRGALRGFGTERNFRTALLGGDYDLLLVGRGSPPKPEVRLERWARGAGFTQALRSDRFTLFRPPRALNP